MPTVVVIENPDSSGIKELGSSVVGIEAVRAISRVRLTEDFTVDGEVALAWG